MFGDEKRYLIVLGILWLVMQIVVYSYFARFTSIDTIFYLEAAENLLNGEMLSDRSWFYVSYAGLLSMIQWLGMDVEYVILIQLLCSLFAAYSIFILARQINDNSFAGFIAALLYVLWIKIHQWNFMIYTDSLFCSMTIMVFATIYNSRKRLNWLILFLLIAFTIFIRPNGIGLGIAVLLYLIERYWQKRQINRFLKIGIVTGCFFFLFVVVNVLLEDYVDEFFASYLSAEIIYPKIQLLINSQPDIILPKDNWPPLIRLIFFAISNPIYFGKLFFLKAVLFLANVKPYYSWEHNLLIAFILYPIYFYAIRGLALLEDKPTRSFVIVFIVLQIGIVSLTSENWDGRFLIPVLPFVFLAASGTLEVKLRKFYHGLSSQFQNL